MFSLFHVIINVVDMLYANCLNKNGTLSYSILISLPILAMLVLIFHPLTEDIIISRWELNHCIANFSKMKQNPIQQVEIERMANKYLRPDTATGK